MVDVEGLGAFLKEMHRAHNLLELAWKRVVVDRNCILGWVQIATKEVFLYRQLRSLPSTRGFLA
jgi:hypothetical protein